MKAWASFSITGGGMVVDRGNRLTVAAGSAR